MMNPKIKRLEFYRPLQKKRKLSKAVVIAASIAFGLGGIAAIAVGIKLRGDPEVMDDIDRHFEKLDRYAPEKLEDQGSPGLAGKAGRDAPLLSSGRKTSQSGGSGQRVNGAGAGRTTRGNPQYSKIPEPAAASQPESLWKGIRQIAPGTYAIDEALMDQARKNPKQFAGNASAVVAEVDGEPAGFRIGSLKGDSAIRALGLGNGDVITAVNGHELKNVDEALAAAASMRFSNKYRVDILRGGQKLSFYYRVE